jgi:O-antigen/teichoic acid export membrane protein
MLQAALSDVSLSVLSKISSERERLATIYRVSTVIAANLLAPFFLLSAALSTEICTVLFGNKWNGIDVIARPLFFLGAVQVIQFLSRPYLSARGKSEKVLIISASKFVLLVAGLLIVPHQSVYQLVIGYVLLQLLAAPVSFYMTSRELGAPIRRIVRDLAPVALAGGLADRAVWLVRPHAVSAGLNGSLLRGMALGMVFAAVYALVIGVAGRAQLKLVIEFLRNRLKGKQAT